MTIFEFVRSRGWECGLMGRWFKPDFHPQQNTLTLEQVLERIKSEDIPSIDPNQQNAAQPKGEK